MTSTEIAIASKIMIGSTLASAMYIGSEQLWPVELHEYVEIGGLRWATKNIGANSVTDTGLYFQWGDTQGYTTAQVGSTIGKKYFGWADYKYGNGTSSPDAAGMTKYNSTDGKTVLDLEDDAARANWGGSWRMPTTDEFVAFGNAVNRVWTNNYQGSGVAGIICTDKTDSSKVLFFPASGYCHNGSVGLVGICGYCWSSSLRSNYVQSAYALSSVSSNTSWGNIYNRDYGLPIRAVMDIDYSLDYFTIESLEDSNTIRIEKNGSAPNISLSYSTNNGTTWTDLTASASIDLTTINTGDKVIFKGTNSTLSSKYNAYWNFAPSKNFNVYGNAMSLLFGDNFINNSEFASGTTCQLNGLLRSAKTLINAKNLILPATTATNRCYYNMFRGCTNLITAPELPATTLSDYCYYSMFYGCSGLATAPALPATTLAGHCYHAMFTGCTLLNHVKALFTTDISSTTDYTYNWLYGVAATGTFIKNKNATWSRTDASGVPSGWTVELYEDVMHDYSLDYFTIESLEDNNSISIQKTSNSPGNKNMSYSLDEGVTWTDLTLTNNTSITTINTGDKILFKGTNSTLSNSWDKHWHFRGGKTFKTYGNAMSLLFGDDFENNSEFTSGTTHNLCGIFYGTTTLVDASNLILPATNCNDNCYNGMFRGCTGLTIAPKLPATRSAFSCYSSMFEGCINLENAPDIELIDLSSECCQRMFCMNRNNKITTPKMTKSPILRVATGNTNCYKEMFKGNGNLVEVTCLMTSLFSCDNWLTNCSSTGTFKKASTASWSTSTSGIPSGWTVETYVES